MLAAQKGLQQALTTVVRAVPSNALLGNIGKFRTFTFKPELSSLLPLFPNPTSSTILSHNTTSTSTANYSTHVPPLPTPNTTTSSAKKAKKTKKAQEAEEAQETKEAQEAKKAKETKKAKEAEPKAKTKKATKAEVELKAKEAELKTKEAQLKTKEAQLKTKEAELKTKEAEQKTKEAELKTKEAELKAKEAEQETKEKETKEKETKEKEAKEKQAKEKEAKEKEAKEKEAKEKEAKEKEAQKRAAGYALLGTALTSKDIDNVAFVLCGFFPGERPTYIALSLVAIKYIAKMLDKISVQTETNTSDKEGTISYIGKGSLEIIVRMDDPAQFDSDLFQKKFLDDRITWTCTETQEQMPKIDTPNFMSVEVAQNILKLFHDADLDKFLTTDIKGPWWFIWPLALIKCLAKWDGPTTDLINFVQKYHRQNKVEMLKFWQTILELELLHLPFNWSIGETVHGDLNMYRVLPDKIEEQTPLHYCAAKGLVPFVEELLGSPFYNASHVGEALGVRMKLAEDNDIIKTLLTEKRQSLVDLGLELGEAILAESMLLTKGASYGDLMHTAIETNYLGQRTTLLMRKLIERGVLEDIKPEHLRNISERILRHGRVDPDHGLFSSYRSRLLQLAIVADNSYAVEVMMPYTDTNTINNIGATPLHYAKSPQVVDLLIKHGAYPGAIDFKHRTPLHYAVEAGVAHSVAHQLVAGIEVEDVSNHTPIFDALLKTDYAALVALIEAGANVHATDNTKSTLLHVALKMRDMTAEIISLLLKSGVDLNAKDSGGHTAYDHFNVSGKGRKPILELLVEAGAPIPDRLRNETSQP